MNHRIRTLVGKLAVALVLSGVLTIAGCSDGGPAYRIGVSQCSNDQWREQQNSEFRMMDYISDSVSIDIKSANDDSRLQAAQIDSLVASGVDLLVVSPNQVDGVTEAIERAYDKGIPVILYDRVVNSQKFTAFIGSDNHDIGFELGSYVARQLGGHGKVAEIRGLEKSSPAKGRHDGFVDALRGYPGVELVASEAADWETAGAEKALDKILAKTRDFDYVYAHNDRMAYGAFLSLRKHNLDDKVKIVGVDGLVGKEGGVEMVCNGILDASYLNPTGGEAVIKLAMKILEHKTFSRMNSLATTIITKDNAELTQMAITNADHQRQVLEQLHQQVARYERYNTNQEFFIWMLAILICLLGAAVVFVTRSYMAKNKLSKQLSKKNSDLKQLNDEVIALTQSRLNFFTNVSHELRTPLTLIVDPVEQLFKDEKLSKHGRSLLVIVRRNANALRQLVDDIMDFRKLQNGKMKLHISAFSLAEKVRQWVEDFYPTVEKKDINLVINVDGYTDSDFVADEEKINRIVFNLVSNAVKFTPVGGTMIVMLCDMPGDKVLISVSDTGKGIAEKDQKKVFDRFFQTSGTAGGTGIGLAIVKAYAELHGGEVAVESQEGKGSNFKVVVPRTQKGNPALPEVAVDDETAHAQPTTLSVDAGMKHSLLQKVIGDGSKQTLLIVDDNKDIREYMKSVLSSDYVIMEAADGNEALQLAKRYVPDLVLSDVMMPGIGGLELCSELKQNSTTCHIPVIIVTAKTMDEQIIEGYENGADAYITKPFSTKMLKTRIENLLHNRRMMQMQAAEKSSAGVNEQQMTDADKDFVSRLRTIIQHNMGYSEFGVEAIGREMGFSRVQLYRKVKAVMGISVVDLLRKSRLQRAKTLLEQTDKGIAEIAYEVGFSSPSYFSKCFKDEYDMNPGDVRNH